MKHLLIWFIKFYRATISPWYGQVCRYYPSCSAYGLEAVQVHGAAKGSWLIVKRITSCHPWQPGGYDPVPGTPAWQEWQREQAAQRDEGDAAAQSKHTGTVRDADEPRGTTDESTHDEGTDQMSRSA
ncbi:membrane protein insertion efficiency factor YidD [Parenemella sanctibonifatiensis]|uniref:Putative membrane protein insertion efficiency factor n=1 Tax=Parenemella sanctibonifatiensis TaxID=2016505 RepID=A0A255EFI3_9ACTN|nr:membrane protein insertion efficiency factor YidD [Parenemella sanctibonifatiensis]OYN90289.1 membrane protein insertion efficiency factor YidD [Parenemella sanctibonifatiensis]